jgi:hypothetical protein
MGLVLAIAFTFKMMLSCMFWRMGGVYVLPSKCARGRTQAKAGRARIGIMSLRPGVMVPFRMASLYPGFPWCQCQTGHPFIAWYIQGIRRLEEEVMQPKARGIFHKLPLASQAVKGGSLYRTHATMTLAEVMGRLC